MYGKIHFLEETINFLNQNGKTEEDVLWVGRGFSIGRGFSRFIYTDIPEEYKTTWEDFKSKADFWYDRGYGQLYIPDDLIIVGKDFWLERAEYDGSEWWEFKTMPTEPVLTKELDLSEVHKALEWEEQWKRRIETEKQEGALSEEELEKLFEW